MWISWPDRWGLSVCLCQEEFVNIIPLITNYTSERGFTARVLDMWNSIIRDLQGRWKIDGWHQTSDKEAKAARQQLLQGASGGGRGQLLRGTGVCGGAALRRTSHFKISHPPVISYTNGSNLLGLEAAWESASTNRWWSKGRAAGQHQLQLQQRAPQDTVNSGSKKRRWRT